MKALLRLDILSYSSIWMLAGLAFLGGQALAQQTGEAEVAQYAGMICPTLCPGEQLVAFTESLSSEDELATEHNWNNAGCALIDFSNGQLSFDFSSFDNSEDVDWILVRQDQISPDGELSFAATSEDHEGPMLGRLVTPHVGSTGEDGSSFMVQGEYLLLYTQWGASAKTGQVSLTSGDSWESNAPECIEDSYSIIPSLVHKTAVVNIPNLEGYSGDATLKIIDSQGRVFREYEGVSAGTFDLDLSGFSTGMGEVMIQGWSGAKRVIVLKFVKI